MGDGDGDKHCVLMVQAEIAYPGKVERAKQVLIASHCLSTLDLSLAVAFAGEQPSSPAESKVDRADRVLMNYASVEGVHRHKKTSSQSPWQQ